VKFRTELRVVSFRISHIDACTLWYLFVQGAIMSRKF
jgi:hypothetical protein